jgi:hypothetical protein
MLTRRMPASLSRVGLSIVSALLVTVVSLTLVALNAEAKKVSGGPGCGGTDLVELLDLADPGDTIQIMTGANPWPSGGAVITKNILIQGGWAFSSGLSCSDPAAIFQFRWPTERSIIDHFGDSVVTIDPTVLSATIQYLDIVSNGGAGSKASGIHGVISNSAKILLDNVVVRDGNAVRGGLYLEVRGGSRLVMSNMQITNNTGNAGGGFEIHVFDNSQVIIQGSQIASNTASNGNGGGGLIVIHKGSVTLAGNTFFNNDASGSGDDLSVEAAVGGGPAYLILQNNSFSNAPDLSGNLTVLDKQIFLPIVRKN